MTRPTKAAYSSFSTTIRRRFGVKGRLTLNARSRAGLVIGPTWPRSRCIRRVRAGCSTAFPGRTSGRCGELAELWRWPRVEPGWPAVWVCHSLRGTGRRRDGAFGVATGSGRRLLGRRVAGPWRVAGGSSAGLWAPSGRGRWAGRNVRRLGRRTPGRSPCRTDRPDEQLGRRSCGITLTAGQPDDLAVALGGPGAGGSGAGGEVDDLFVGEVGGLDAAGDAVFGAQPRDPACLGVDLGGGVALVGPAVAEDGVAACFGGAAACPRVHEQDE